MMDPTEMILLLELPIRGFKKLTSTAIAAQLCLNKKEEYFTVCQFVRIFL